MTNARREHRLRAGLSRRAFLSAGAGAAAVLGASLGSGPLAAQAAPHRLKVGAVEIVVLSDGYMDVPIGLMLPGRDPAAIESAFKAAGQVFSGLRAEINVAVVRTGAETILVDTGGGPDFMPSLGRLAERLEAAGIPPEAITKVVFTHAHPDHFWGVVDPLGGGTMFERAEHLMCAAEFDFWMSDDVETRVPDAFRGMAVGTHRRLKSVADRIRKVAPGTEITPGVQLVATHGHTPGHVSVLVKSGAEQLFIGGDVIVQQIISFAEPGWKWGPDLDGERGIASRRRTLDQLATDRVRLLGYHMAWPGIGWVERRGAAFRFVPA